MHLYLVQHGLAKSKEEDPERPLSGEGMTDAGKMAAFLAKRGVRIDRIYHSGKLRAKQTADIFGEKLGITGMVADTDGLAPSDDPQIWEKRLVGKSENIMLVGHLPHLSRLASLLLAGGTERNTVEFKNAGVICAKRDESGRWSLQWMVIPELAGQ